MNLLHRHPRLTTSLAALTVSLVIGCRGQIDFRQGRGTKRPQPEQASDPSATKAAVATADQAKEESTGSDEIEAEPTVEFGPQTEIQVGDPGIVGIGTPAPAARTAYQAPPGRASYKCRSKQSYQVPSSAGDLAFDRLELSGATALSVVGLDGVYAVGKNINGVFVWQLSATKGGETALIIRSSQVDTGDQFLALEHASRPAAMPLSEPCVYRFRFDEENKLRFEE